jgi:hypothetical protein
MRDWAFLLAPPGEGQVTLTNVPPGALWDDLQALHSRGLLCRFLRGTRMETAIGLFAEFAAAFQFPPYVSATFDGLDECLNDLDWLPIGPLALVVLSADRVLVQENAADQEAFTRILGSALTAWNNGENGSPRAFNVIFQTAAEA